MYSGRGDYAAEDLDDLEEELEDLDDHHQSETEWGEDQEEIEEIEISARRGHRFTDKRNAFVLEARDVALGCVLSFSQGWRTTCRIAVKDGVPLAFWYPELCVLCRGVLPCTWSVLLFVFAAWTCVVLFISPCRSMFVLCRWLWVYRSDFMPSCLMLGWRETT